MKYPISFRPAGYCVVGVWWHLANVHGRSLSDTTSERAMLPQHNMVGLVICVPPRNWHTTHVELNHRRTLLYSMPRQWFLSAVLCRAVVDLWNGSEKTKFKSETKLNHSRRENKSFVFNILFIAMLFAASVCGKRTPFTWIDRPQISSLFHIRFLSFCIALHAKYVGNCVANKL